MKIKLKKFMILLSFSSILMIIPFSIISCSNNYKNNHFNYSNLSKNIVLSNSKQLDWNNLIPNQTATAINNWTSYFNNETKTNQDFENVLVCDLNQFKNNINHVLNLTSNWFYGFMFNHTLINFSERGVNFSGINNLAWAAKPTSTISQFEYSINNKSLNLSYVINTSYTVAATKKLAFWQVNENDEVTDFVSINRKVIVTDATISPCLVNYPYNFSNYSIHDFYVYGGFYINFAKSLIFTDPIIKVNKTIKDNQKFLTYFDNNFVKEYLQNQKLINSSSAIGNKINFTNPTSQTFNYSMFNNGYNFKISSDSHLNQIRDWLNNYHNPLTWTQTVNVIPNLSLFNFTYQTSPMIFLDCYNHSRYYGTYSNEQYLNAYNEYKLNQLSSLKDFVLNTKKDLYE